MTFSECYPREYNRTTYKLQILGNFYGQLSFYTEMLQPLLVDSLWTTLASYKKRIETKIPTLLWTILLNNMKYAEMSNLFYSSFNMCTKT